MTKQEAIYEACELIAINRKEFSCHALKDVNRSLYKKYKKFIKNSNYIWKEWDKVYLNDGWDCALKLDINPNVRIGLRVLTLLLFLEIGLKGIQ